jgi:hypothetical protein
MSTIRKIKIVLEPVIIEFDPVSDTMQKGVFDASPKRIADLAAGDRVRLEAQVAEVQELPDVPTLDTWEPDFPQLPPRGTGR